MGARFGHVCYSNPSDAVDAYFSSSTPTAYKDVNYLYLPYYVKQNDVWKFKMNHYSGSSQINTTSVDAPVPFFPPCTPDNAAFDYAGAAAIFSFFFSFVVGTWYVSKNFGLILSAVKRF